MTERTIFVAGALLAAIGVAAGAFGAHTLSARLPADRLLIFEVGVRYQMYHALALLALAWAAGRWPAPALGTASMIMVAGVLIFAGTLYAIALGGPRWLGAITPIGGTALIAAWLIAALSIWKSP